MKFSELPGSRERHLQRRDGNLLFPESVRNPDPAEILAARQADAADADRFVEELQSALEQAVSLPPNAESDVVLKLRGDIERLYEQSIALPGDHSNERNGLQKLYEVVMRAVRGAAGDDRLAMKELEDAEAARALHLKLLEYPLVADLLQPESPIGEDELLPTLLSEPVEVVKAVLTMFDQDQQVVLQQHGRELMERLKAEGHDLPDAWAVLALLEHRL
ncbi:hypothetical protein [Candidatus Reidiella endopervernicosa]|uniref:Uncharacterized protein n=1 Tax=Candidatus Reidiella endopervernicosa TaxID=2738883 RepID=A0A6N0HZG2_9GAMM|nr:hypothetical protein [Candidatus Reidiella endopervernicosa]QKQ27767.1 hypothetical protein HUE57_16860 [Candidatus Reidiella endopervernicosa]